MICVWREQLFRNKFGVNDRGWVGGGWKNPRCERGVRSQRCEKSGVFSDHTRLAPTAGSNTMASPAPRMLPN